MCLRTSTISAESYIQAHPGSQPQEGHCIVATDLTDDVGTSAQGSHPKRVALVRECELLEEDDDRPL